MHAMTSTLDAKDYLLNKRVIETQLPLLVDFARSLASYRAISNDFARIERNQSFWIQTADSNFLRAVTIWCMIFGVDDNEAHWKKAPSNNIAKFKREVRTLACTASQLTNAEWKKYHEEMRNFRNSFVSHRSLFPHGNIPDLTAAYKIADAYFEWIKKQLPGSNQPQPLSGFFSECQIEVLLVLKNDLKAM
jgi:hypothetical protein